MSSWSSEREGQIHFFPLSQREKARFPGLPRFVAIQTGTEKQQMRACFGSDVSLDSISLENIPIQADKRPEIGLAWVLENWGEP